MAETEEKGVRASPLRGLQKREGRGPPTAQEIRGLGGGFHCWRHKKEESRRPDSFSGEKNKIAQHLPAGEKILQSVGGGTSNCSERYEKDKQSSERGEKGPPGRAELFFAGEGRGGLTMG